MIETLLGRKVGMTRVFDENAMEQPVTVLKMGPCWVVQKKTMAEDGYLAVQLGFENVSDKRVNQPNKGHFQKAGLDPCRFLREVRADAETLADLNVGDEVNVGIFHEGDIVAVTGTSKGRGFQGMMRRWNARGGPDGHGSMSHRKPGAIGMASYPGRVLKGKKLPGKMGNKRVTVKNLEVVQVDEANGHLVLLGAVPGPNGGLVVIKRLKEASKEG